MGLIHMADTLGNSHRNYGHIGVVLLGVVLDMEKGCHITGNHYSTGNTVATILSRTVGYIVDDRLFTDVLDERVLLFIQGSVFSFGHWLFLLG
jgi:hypothetical protein